jgi:hypothetical protein
MRAALDIIRGQIPTRTAVDISFHGKMIAPDPYMDGSSRFAVMYGSDVVSLRSQNHEVATEIIAAGSNLVVTATVIGDVEVGSVIAIANTEHLVVSDTLQTTDVNGNKVTEYTTATAVLGVYDVGTQVTFESFPIQVIQGTDVNNTKILVDSKRVVVVGDVLTLVTTPEALTYLTDVATVTSVQAVFKFTDRMRYIIGVSLPKLQITSDLVTHVRVNTAYTSEELQLPELSGPYLADVIGGKTYGTAAESISLSVTAPIDGASTSVDRNGVAFSLPVKAGDLSLLTHEFGNSHVISEDEIVATPESSTRWGCGIIFAVPAPLQLNWIVTASSALTFMIETDAGTDTIEIASGAYAAVLKTYTKTSKLILRAVSNGAFHISTNPMRDGIRSFRYSYVVRLTGNEIWSGAGIVLKPLFPRLGDAIASTSDQDGLFISSGGLIL